MKTPCILPLFLAILMFGSIPAASALPLSSTSMTSTVAADSPLSLEVPSNIDVTPITASHGVGLAYWVAPPNGFAGFTIDLTVRDNRTDDSVQVYVDNLPPTWQTVWPTSHRNICNQFWLLSSCTLTLEFIVPLSGPYATGEHQIFFIAVSEKYGDEASASTIIHIVKPPLRVQVSPTSIVANKGETFTVNVTVESREPTTVSLTLQDLPSEWTAQFTQTEGYADPYFTTTLHVTVDNNPLNPQCVSPNNFTLCTFTVSARSGEGYQADEEFRVRVRPLEITITQPTTYTNTTAPSVPTGASSVNQYGTGADLMVAVVVLLGIVGVSVAVWFARRRHAAQGRGEQGEKGGSAPSGGSMVGATVRGVTLALFRLIGIVIVIVLGAYLLEVVGSFCETTYTSIPQHEPLCPAWVPVRQLRAPWKLLSPIVGPSAIWSRVQGPFQSLLTFITTTFPAVGRFIERATYYLGTLEGQGRLFHWVYDNLMLAPMRTYGVWGGFTIFFLTVAFICAVPGLILHALLRRRRR
jgi:hypothetical protein